ncbi:MAG: twin-arginine translocation signal domain-containing protein, partial [Planctomycetes bacterium]|nr:twin-arginine translocation signal domain-containing protein [Planctomycetota bacterium]
MHLAETAASNLSRRGFLKGALAAGAAAGFAAPAAAHAAEPPQRP